MSDNNTTTVHAVAAIDAYQEHRKWEGDAETILCLLLADARSYADAHGLDYARIDREAYTVYLECK